MCVHIYRYLVLYLVRSLFLQVSKTWVIGCTSLHSLHKGSFVLVFLKLLSRLSSVQLASIYLLNLPDSMPNWAPHGFSLGWAGLKWAGFGEWALTGPHMG